VALKLYFDHNCSSPITVQLARRDVSVVTAWQDGHSEAPDLDLLDRATALSSVLVTTDEDLLIEAVRRQRAGIPFAGVIYCHQRALAAVGARVAELELLAKASEPSDLVNQVRYLPL